MDRRQNEGATNIVGCSGGSVYDHKLEGGFAWSLYERIDSNELRSIGVTGVGKDTRTGLESHSVHSYRVEALGLLAASTYLRQRGWQGTLEWHIDCKGVINTLDKLTWQRYTDWYAQRDKDVWERLKIEKQFWKNRLSLIHVKAHVDQKKGHVSTPEQRRNQEMDVLAKRACLTNMVEIQNVSLQLGWQVWMHEHRVTGHTKSSITEQIKYDRLKTKITTKKDLWGEQPQEIAFQHMIGTAPPKSKCSAKHEAQFLWGELPTNDKTHEWGLNDMQQCECCGCPCETNIHTMMHCTQRNICNIRSLAQGGIIEAVRDAGGNHRLQRIVKKLYQLNPNDTVHTWTKTNAPVEWVTAYRECPEDGHIMLSDQMHGFAAEIVKTLGDTTPLWNGVITKAWVKLMEAGKITPHEMRKMIQKIRTHLHTAKRSIWKIRNNLNYREDVEQRRVRNRTMRERVTEHIACNDAAKNSDVSAEEVIAMPQQEREEWMRSTTDASMKQPAIDEVFAIVNEHDEPVAPTNDTRDAADVVNENTTPSSRLMQQSITFGPQQREVGYTSVGTISQAAFHARIAAAEKNKRTSKIEYEKRCRKHRSSSSAQPKHKSSAGASEQTEVPGASSRSNAERPSLPEWYPQEHNEKYETCDRGGKLLCCYSCNLVWHKRCNQQLLRSRNVSDFWQCAECVQEERETHGEPHGSANDEPTNTANAQTPDDGANASTQSATGTAATIAAATEDNAMVSLEDKTEVGALDEHEIDVAADSEDEIEDFTDSDSEDETYDNSDNEDEQVRRKKKPITSLKRRNVLDDSESEDDEDSSDDSNDDNNSDERKDDHESESDSDMEECSSAMAEARDKKRRKKRRKEEQNNHSDRNDDTTNTKHNEREGQKRKAPETQQQHHQQDQNQSGQHRKHKKKKR